MHVLKAPAKVNLFLNVTGKDETGKFHLLESLVVFTDLCDLLKVELGKGRGGNIELVTTGPFASALSDTPGGDNYITKAWELCSDMCGMTERGVTMHLEKNIPIASGMGGGTADAAAIMHFFSQEMAVVFTDKELGMLSKHLGKEIYLCYANTTSYVGGTGEFIEPLLEKIPQLFFVLVNPMLSVSTVLSYANLQKEFYSPKIVHRPASFESVEAVVDFLRRHGNALTRGSIKLCPEIADVLGAISSQDACLISRMSGSGATCFGLFAYREQADMAAANIRSQEPGWWVKVVCNT
jgi:4-diphosphocytidyl-2-C-methyl-D-erythritol kinase